MHRHFVVLLLALVVAAAHARADAQELRASGNQGTQQTSLTPAQLFAFADAARDRGDHELAEQAYRALATNPDVELRTEARFRLALMLHDQLGRTREAAVLLREILDEKPDAARVRVELARMQASLGNMRAAERELRAAQAAGGLPPEVERMVQFYASALNAARPFGFNAELALAPDTNINRATRSETLGTIIGDFDLSEDARERSGVGLSTKAQFWGRLPASASVDLRGEINASADLYRDGSFNDIALGVKLGPQLQSGRDTLALSGVAQKRWFGGDLYTNSVGIETTWRHPMGRRAQAGLDASVTLNDDQINDLRDAEIYSLGARYDRAFTSQLGGGIRLTGWRNDARDPGYATIGAGVSSYLYREFNGITVAANAGYSHLAADERIFLYPGKREDDRLSLGLSSTLRRLQVATFAPVIGVSFERNWSTVEIYDYQRIAGRVGVTAAF